MRVKHLITGLISMTFGTGVGSLRYSLLVSFLLLLVSVQTTAKEWDRAELMALLATTKGSEQRYTETRQLDFLEGSVTSQGRLIFSPPDRLVKQVDPPDSSRYEIMGDTMTIRRPGEAEQVVSIDAHPLLRLFIDTLRALLMGDLKLLEQHHAIALTGNRDAWQLQLSPQDSQLAASVEWLIITGHDGHIEQMITQEQSGDQTVLILHGKSE